MSAQRPPAVVHVQFCACRIANKAALWMHGENGPQMGRIYSQEPNNAMQYNKFANILLLQDTH
jgi:hypothetical protein